MNVASEYQQNLRQELIKETRLANMRMKRDIILVGVQLRFSILSWMKYKGSAHMLLTVLYGIFCLTLISKEVSMIL